MYWAPGVPMLVRPAVVVSRLTASSRAAQRMLATAPSPRIHGLITDIVALAHQRAPQVAHSLRSIQHTQQQAAPQGRIRQFTGATRPFGIAACSLALALALHALHPSLGISTKLVNERIVCRGGRHYGRIHLKSFLSGCISISTPERSILSEHAFGNPSALLASSPICWNQWASWSPHSNIPFPSPVDSIANPMCKFSCQRKGSWSLLYSEELYVSEEENHEPGRLYYHMFRID